MENPIRVIAGGVVLGAAGDALLRSDGPPGLGMALWIASVAASALVVYKTAGRALDGEREAWLAAGVLFGGCLAWRDAPPLKLLGLGCVTLTFALAAYRHAGRWVRRAGFVRYASALAMGALHTIGAAALALGEARPWLPARDAGASTRWTQASAVGRGLLLAAPLVLVFGALFMSADDVFAQAVENAIRFDFEWIAGHALLFAFLTWISIGFLRGFLVGTEPGRAEGRPDIDLRDVLLLRRPAPGITEIATVLAIVNLLFLAFVAVQFRYLFGAGMLVQVTPGLTYAEYARRGFFELVAAVALVVPVLLVLDWMLDRRAARDGDIFAALAGLLIALVLAVAASAFQRLSLYHASYGLTESRFYAMALLIWMSAMLLWLAATVLRGRRESFAFGMLVSGLGAAGILFAVNPDAIVARANVARIVTADMPLRFDAAYATRLSADAVPVLLDALPSLPPDVQCPLARHMLRRWPPGAEVSMRGWSWSRARAAAAVRAHEAQLRVAESAIVPCEAAPQGLNRPK